MYNAYTVLTWKKKGFKLAVQPPGRTNGWLVPFYTWLTTNLFYMDRCIVWESVYDQRLTGLMINSPMQFESTVPSLRSCFLTSYFKTTSLSDFQLVINYLDSFFFFQILLYIANNLDWEIMNFFLEIYEFGSPLVAYQHHLFEDLCSNRAILKHKWLRHMFNLIQPCRNSDKWSL